MLSGLRLFCCKLSADCFHLIASCGNPLPPVRRCINQLFEAGGKLWSIGSSDFAQQRFEFREDPNVLAVAVIEELQTDNSVVDQSCRHFPIGYDHAQITALLAKDRNFEI